MKLSSRLAIMTSFATLLAFAGLIPLGRWHDEYLTLYSYHASGSRFFVDRLLHWSPRPLSELLAYIYAAGVYATGSPLIGEFLLPFWLVFIAALLLPVLRNAGGFACAWVLLALLLLGHPVAEVFYWPFGTVAYLPTVAATALLLTLDWGGRIENDSGLAWVVAALLVAAASSEVGALFTCIYTLLLISSRSLGIRKSLPFVIPLLLALGVLYLQFTGRVVAANEVFGDPLVAHHPIVTALAVAKLAFFELAKGDIGHHFFTRLISGLATKALFFYGVYLTMSAREGHGDQRMRPILVVTSIFTAVLTIAAALYNFGSVCCERHATVRQEYVFIALGSLATYLAARWPSHRHRHAGIWLLCSLLIPLAASLPKLQREYLDYSETRQAGMMTWQSGRSVGPVMHMTQTMPGPITGGLYIEPGIYGRAAKSHSDAPWMLIFFNKQSVVVEPPSKKSSADAAQRP